MAFEIAWVPVAKAVATAAGNIAKAYRTYQDQRREEVQQLQLRAEAALRREMAHLNGELARVHVEEIAITARFINAQNLSGPALDQAMQQLSVLSGKLALSLAEFSSQE